MHTPEPRNAETIAAALAKLRTRRPTGIMHGNGKHGGPDGEHGGTPGGTHDETHDGAHSGTHDESRRGAHGGRGGRGRGRGGMALMRMLETLASSGSALSVSEIGDEIGVDQPRASRLVQQAVAHGLVFREADPEDARRSRVAITEEGRARAELAQSERRVPLERALTALEIDEQTELARLLTKLAANWPLAQ